ncbi:MAG: IgA Peptidase M64 [Ignavibacteriaceae bacterium]|nr:IgA Peptidase M64 [Ignavibacteriaceae bacterium]
MKKVFFLFLISTVAFGQVKFDDYFENKTLRLDYYHTGDKTSDSYSIDELLLEPHWGGSKTNLIDPFNFGRYKVMVYDEPTNALIFTKTYSTLFSEWQTTDEAMNTVKTFSETVTMPFPKNKVRVEFYSRGRQNELIKKYEYTVNPKDYFIKPEMRFEYNSFKVLYSGNPSDKVDIVIIPEGYTSEEMEKFKADCDKFAGYLFNASPFKESKDKFNIWGVEAASKESGTDIPAKNVWKKTVVNSNFYTFDLERYLMTSDNKTLRDVAANAPYDQIYILVNSNKYGGGSIYNHYSVCVNSNPHEEYVFVHEFGHGFAFLADEYYTSDVAYNEFYPLDIEPLEKNITTLINFDDKWKDALDNSTPIPTPATDEYIDKVGVFEGGGYAAKGIYRAKQDCTMKSISVNNFCPVCKKTIQDMIDFYTK